MENQNQQLNKLSINIKLKKLIGEFSKLLRIRMNELGYEPYWQKEMCLHWDNIKGCTANENNCDSCISFKKNPTSVLRKVRNNVL